MSGGIEREYRRRRGVPAANFSVATAAVLVVVNALSAMTTSRPMAWQTPALAAWLFAGGRVVLEQWRARTYVTAEGVTVRGPLRTRTWPWAGVYGIRVEEGRRGSPGSPRWPAYLYGTDGRRVRLPHLDELQLDDPVAEVSDLCAAAVRLGLTYPETRPEVEERIRRAARRRTAWQRAVAAGLVVAAAMFVLDTWLVFTDRPDHPFLLLVCVPLLCLPAFFLLLDRVGEARVARRCPGHA
ncbi:PH domain-containing protein [Streptomyces sp. NPDC046862]|uniref:PH domain-containing protein n=1 Tax=Streptomyces sp. NPDC046862 TaxID=3154603 RepID=UPI003452FE96